MEKCFLLRGCCLRWINPLGGLQELSSVGHPQAPGEQPMSPTSLCPSLAHYCIPTAGRSQNVLAWKALAKIIKVQLLKGPVQVQAVRAFCFPSGLCCCSADPAQGSQLKTQSLAAVSGHSHVGGHGSVRDGQPDPSYGHCPSALGCSSLQGSPLRAAPVGMAWTDGDWHSAVPSAASLPC